MTTEIHRKLKQGKGKTLMIITPRINFGIQVMTFTNAECPNVEFFHAKWQAWKSIRPHSRIWTSATIVQNGLQAIQPYTSPKGGTYLDKANESTCIESLFFRTYFSLLVFVKPLWHIKQVLLRKDIVQTCRQSPNVVWPNVGFSHDKLLIPVTNRNPTPFMDLKFRQFRTEWVQSYNHSYHRKGPPRLARQMSVSTCILSFRLFSPYLVPVYCHALGQGYLWTFGIWIWTLHPSCALL